MALRGKQTPPRQPLKEAPFRIESAPPIVAFASCPADEQGQGHQRRLVKLGPFVARKGNIAQRAHYSAAHVAQPAHAGNQGSGYS
jgi:hypothetical protein